MRSSGWSMCIRFMNSTSKSLYQFETQSLCSATQKHIFSYPFGQMLKLSNEFLANISWFTALFSGQKVLDQYRKQREV